MLPADAPLTLTPEGLYCPDGAFHIDPWRPTPLAIITHAHSDHARAGCDSYLASPTGAIVLRARLGAGISVESLNWGERRRIGVVTVSLHPAGHILGSAQVRIESRQGVWVVSGDYKNEPPGQHDRTCEPLEPVRCDGFITESTFGLPIYRWPSADRVQREMNEWWKQNASIGRTSIFYAYSLGKAQRVLAALDPSIGPIGVHGAVLNMNRAYDTCGITLPPCVHVSSATRTSLRGIGAIVAPPSAAGGTWTRGLRGDEGIGEAFASGWMRIRGRRRWRSIDRGFVMSDHADWPGLLSVISETGASRVGVTHGSTLPLSRWLNERGIESFVVPTRFTGESASPDSADGDDDEGAA